MGTKMVGGDGTGAEIQSSWYLKVPQHRAKCQHYYQVD